MKQSIGYVALVVRDYDEAVRGLWLAHTGLTDACVEAIMDVPGLEWVDVTNSSITPSGIARLRAARPSITIRVR